MQGRTLATGALALGVVGVVMAACMPGPRHSGAALYGEYCAACHGAGGTGTAAGRDLTTLAARNGGVFPLSLVLARVDGYARSGFSRADMPQIGYMMEGRLRRVTTAEGISFETPEMLLAIVEHLEAIQR